MGKIQIWDQESRMEKIWIPDPGWETLVSGIQDPGLTSQISKTGNFIAKFART
jgi:hypothetical protein